MENKNNEQQIFIMNEVCLPDQEQYTQHNNSLEICPKCGKVKCTECKCK